MVQRFELRKCVDKVMVIKTAVTVTHTHKTLPHHNKSNYRQTAMSTFFCKYMHIHGHRLIQKYRCENHTLESLYQGQKKQHNIKLMNVEHLTQALAILNLLTEEMDSAARCGIYS